MANTDPGVRHLLQDTRLPLTDAPSNAAAAPKGNTSSVFVGLCDALNDFQKKLVSAGLYGVADEYVIQFAPASLKQSTIKIPGTIEYKATPTVQSKTAANQLNSATNNMNTNARVVPVVAGLQIVQFIDQVMRSSSYITDQANVVIDEVTGEFKPNLKAESDSEINWYKITLQTEQLGWDKKRNDFAYRMTYTINTFAINYVESQFFSNGKLRGIHKSYKYWFTGQNTQILNFEQQYDNMYNTVLTSTINGESNGLSAIPAGLTNRPSSSAAAAAAQGGNSGTPKSYAPNSSVSNQGADNKANEIGASLADFLYATTDKSNVKLRIIGDPAWIMQGEITNSVNAASIGLGPFNADGAINFDAGQVMFDVYFNRPNDYNFSTGLVNVNGQTINPGGSLAAVQPQAHILCVAQSVTSYFNNGKFEQELEGSVYSPWLTGNEVTPDTPRSQITNNTALQSRDAQLSTEGLGVARVPVAGGNGRWDGDVDNPVSDTTTNSETGSITAPSTQPAKPAGAPVSNGDIFGPPVTLASGSAQALNILSLPGQAIRGALSTTPQTMQPGDDATGK